MKKVVCMVLVFFFFNAVGMVFSQDPIPPIQQGDVDENNEVNIIDALLIAQYYVGMDPEGLVNLSVADVNYSFTIDIIDALLIAQFYVGIISEFPVFEFDYYVVSNETFSITLETNPSTGYEWFVTIEKPSLLFLDYDSVINCGELPGSPCEHIFVFGGLETGNTEITFECYRDYNPLEIIDSVTYLVHIY